MPFLVLIEKSWFKSLFSRFTVETVQSCIFVTASRKSERSFIGAFLPDLKNQFFLKSLELLRGWAIRVVFLCQFVHLDALLLSPTNFELRITTC